MTQARAGSDLLSLKRSGLVVSVTPRRKMLLPDEPILLPLMGEYRIYDEVIYDMLTRDEVRNALYERAIRRRAPGAIALDIGTGRDVNWAHACIRAGARRAYAVEELEASFQGARETIARLGLEDKIILLRGNSRSIELPERVDLCVSEIIGGIGSAEGAPAILHDARERLMKPGAAMIPERCQVKIAAVELPPAIHQRPAFSYGWATYLDRVFEQIGHPFDIKVHIDRLPSSCLLSTEDVFEDFDYTGQISVESRRVARMVVQRKGRIDGFVTRNLLWCSKEDRPLDAFFEGGTFSPSPFFPVFYPGLEVDVGDVIEMTCTTVPSDDGILPDYTLQGELHRAAGATPLFHEAAHHKPRLRGNAFYEALFPRPVEQ